MGFLLGNGVFGGLWGFWWVVGFLVVFLAWFGGGFGMVLPVLFRVVWWLYSKINFKAIYRLMV